MHYLSLTLHIPEMWYYNAPCSWKRSIVRCKVALFVCSTFSDNIYWNVHDTIFCKINHIVYNVSLSDFTLASNYTAFSTFSATLYFLMMFFTGIHSMLFFSTILLAFRWFLKIFSDTLSCFHCMMLFCRCFFTILLSPYLSCFCDLLIHNFYYLWLLHGIL